MAAKALLVDDWFGDLTALYSDWGSHLNPMGESWECPKTRGRAVALSMDDRFGPPSCVSPNGRFQPWGYPNFIQFLDG